MKTHFVELIVRTGTLAFLFASLLLSRGESADQPNILFILSEDQGNHLSYLNTPGLQTPHIDAIAKRGTYFNQAFVAYPVCSASKAAIYTSLHAHTNGLLNNTMNLFKPAEKVTAKERQHRLFRGNRIAVRYITLIQVLHDNGYYQGVTHKLHVLPNDKFPFDEFLHKSANGVSDFLKRAKRSEKPWFLMVNIPNSHRPYPNSDKKTIRVKPDDVAVPKYLPDTPTVRKDWAEYLAAIEEVDHITGQTMKALEDSGDAENTIVIYISDHGPTFQHGKMTLYDGGVHVPMIVAGPGIRSGERTDELASSMDLMPTLIDLIERQSGRKMTLPSDGPNRFGYRIDGVSLAGVLAGTAGAKGHELIFGEISDRGPLPNDGMQERSVFDGRWKLIYREKTETGWRQVNADSRLFPTWGNRTYAETVRVKDRFPEQYRVLQEMDPQNLAGQVPSLELYDLQKDPYEMKNLVRQSEYQPIRDRLMASLKKWSSETNDDATSL